MERGGQQDSADRGVWCVLPVYNHAGTAARVARECRARIPRVLVVDDGSEDADLRVLLAGEPVEVVRHDRNLGKGAALRTALRHVAARGGTHMITLDGDGQHLPGDLPAFLSALREDPGALVVGCRDFRADTVPGASRFGRKFSNFWVRLETGRALSDTQSGYRAYPVGPVSRLRHSTARYDFEIEVLVRALWAGLRVREIPVRVVYPPPGRRVSHFGLVRDNARLARLHTRLVGRRLVPWPHARLAPRDPAEDPLEFFRRPGGTLRRMLRENATPAGLAAAAALGSFLAVLPLIHCHTAAILYASTRLHVNRVLALSIQNLYIPPFTPFLCIQLGHYLRHGRWLAEFSRETLWVNLPQRLLEWLLGSLLLAPLFAAIAAAATYFTARALRRRIRRREAG